MTSTDTMLPCPFCGGAAEVREWDFPYVRFQARCVGCKTTGRTRFNDRAKAIAAWNRRTPPTPATEEREAVARAEQAERSGVIIALWAEYRAQSSEKLPVTIDDAHSRHRYLVSAFADAALSALAPVRAQEIAAARAEEQGYRHTQVAALKQVHAAEILAAEANERARIVASLRATSTGLDLTNRRIADAIERNEHGAGK